MNAPNAPLLQDWSVAIILKRNDGTGDAILGHMITEAKSEADAIGVALAYSAKHRPGEHPTTWSAVLASGTLTEGGDVEQAPGDSLSGPTGNAGDAQ